MAVVPTLREMQHSLIENLVERLRPCSISRLARLISAPLRHPPGLADFIARRRRGLDAATESTRRRRSQNRDVHRAQKLRRFIKG